MNTLRLALSVALVTMLAPLPSQAATLANKYPLVGQMNPRLDKLRERYGDAGACKIIARYDVIVGSAGVIDTDTLPVLRCALALNPALQLSIMHAVWKTDCALVATQPAALRAHLTRLGSFRRRISGVELDGGAVAVAACGLTAVRAAFKAYRRVLAEFPTMSQVLTANGAHFPIKVDEWDYDPAHDGFGFSYALMQGDLNGRLMERWVTRYADPPRTGGVIREACAWVEGGRAPTIFYASQETMTPWWFTTPRPSGVTWREADFGFAASLICPGIVHIHNAAQGGVGDDEATDGERVFWRDQAAVTRRGTVPSYGTDHQRSGDDALDEQRIYSNWLGRRMGEPHFLTADCAMQEFTNGFSVANWGTTPCVAKPRLPTQLIKGRQDPITNSGQAWTSYSLGTRQGLVLIKHSYLDADARRTLHAGMWQSP